jgi:hypothetical protein
MSRFCSKNELAILGYHGVVGRDCSEEQFLFCNTVSVPEFEAQLDYIARHFHRCPEQIYWLLLASPPEERCLVKGALWCRSKVEMSYFGTSAVLLGNAPFLSESIVQNGARSQGFASLRNNRAPLTAPRRSKRFLR